MSNVRTVQIKDIDGVEFLSLPPLCYRRGEAQSSIRAVLDGLRRVSSFINR
jgi:hypothetical protein